MVITDSGPLIHLSMVQQFHLLKQLFPQIATIPQVVEEVVIQGKGRPGAEELEQAIQNKWISIAPVPDLRMVQRLMAPNLSETDSAVIASALAIKATAVLADDSAVRRVAEREGLAVIGTIGILTHARVNGLVGQLKPLLDQLITEGCYLDPSGRVYQDALKRAGER